MAASVGQPARFDRSSPVTRYWLARCEGFAVAGAAKGVVAELVHDGDPFVPDALVLRTGARRTRRIDAAVVSAVVPAQRLLIVERRPRPRRRRPALRRPHALGRAARPAADALRAAFVRLAAEALGALSDGRRLIRSAAWRRSAPSVRFATTRLRRARWPRSLRRRTT